ncbi:hypothetical protein CBL_07532 [Carabus blaptoides fortunei]
MAACYTANRGRHAVIAITVHITTAVKGKYLCNGHVAHGRAPWDTQYAPEIVSPSAVKRAPTTGHTLPFTPHTGHHTHHQTKVHTQKISSTVNLSLLLCLMPQETASNANTNGDDNNSV